jgi:hypothetical protein
MALLDSYMLATSSIYPLSSLSIYLSSLCVRVRIYVCASVYVQCDLYFLFSRNKDTLVEDELTIYLIAFDIFV